MQRIRIFGVTLMAIFAVGAVTSAVANAENTKILPEPTAGEPLTGTSKQEGKGSLLTTGGNLVTCEAGTNTFTFENANTGSTHVLFEKCSTKLLGSTLTCTGVEDKEGDILFLGAALYVLALRMKNSTETELVAALVVLITQFHFTCKTGIIKALVLVKGCSASLTEGIEKLTKSTKDVFKEFSSGESEILAYLKAGTTGTDTACLTETEVNESGKFELSGETGSATNTGFKKGGKEVEILLMN